MSITLRLPMGTRLRAGLGSTRLVTDAPGYVYSSEGRHAYGRLYWSGGSALPTDHKFTGQKLDATGLMYFNARLGLKPRLIAQVRSSRTGGGRAIDVQKKIRASRGNPLRLPKPETLSEHL